MNYLQLVKDDADELRSVYWTALNRQGCHGKIKNCFTESDDKGQNSNVDIYDRSYAEKLTWYFFDTADTGACVALQNRLPDSDNPILVSNFGLFFTTCNSLNKVACEGKGPLSQYVTEESLTEVRKCDSLYFQYPNLITYTIFKIINYNFLFIERCQ